jgi:hypothetical protein
MMGKKKPTSRKLVPAKKAAAVLSDLLGDIRGFIEKARTATAAVNSALVLLYWSIGTRIRTEVLKEKRAEYGKEILSTLSKQLVAEYGNGYSVPNLSRMMRFAEVFPAVEIVSALSAQLGWSHFVEIIPFKEELKREFYAEMCRRRTPPLPCR